MRHGGSTCAATSTREAQVVPGARLVLQVAQQVGRVVGHDQRHALVAVHAAAQPADRLVAAQQALHGEAAHRQDDPRLHQLDLAHQEGLALRQFVGLGIAVARRPALERVGDVDLLRRLGLGARVRPMRAQHVVEQLAGLADEGLALPVFLLARRLADDHPVRLRVADAEHRLAAALAQLAGACSRPRPRAAPASPCVDAGAGAVGRRRCAARPARAPAPAAAARRRAAGCGRPVRAQRDRGVCGARPHSADAHLVAASPAGAQSSAMRRPRAAMARLITTASSRWPCGAG